MEEQQKNKKTNKELSDTWFWKYVVDNKFASILIITFLLFLTLFIFTQVSHLFAPISVIFSITGPPIIFSVLLYYLIEPMVSFLEERNVSKKIAVFIVFAVILVLLAWGIIYLVPGIQDQIVELLENFPRIWDAVIVQAEQLLQNEWLSEALNELQSTDLINRVTDQLSNVFSVTLDSIGNVVGYITRIGVTIFTIPFVLYYLFVDGRNFKETILKYTPTNVRPGVNRFIKESSDQVGSYVQGELLVALSVAIMFYVGYRIIGLEYALVLSILAGVMNLIPYLGSIIAAVPALVIGAFTSPALLIKVIIVIAIEQTVEGRVVSPQILGSSLDIHPIIILFILLVAGSLFGFMGLILAVPGFSVIRVLWNIFFDWIRENYDFYDEEPDAQEERQN